MESTRAAPPDRVFPALEIRLHDLWCLLPVKDIREVVFVPWHQPLLEGPVWVKGLFRYGRDSVPLVDLGMRLLGTPTELDPGHLVVIVEAPHLFGLLVHQLREVVEVDPACMAAPPAGFRSAPYLTGSVAGQGADSFPLLSVPELSREFLEPELLPELE
ncbi:MAG: chemotaxis protein CheW [Armatimonadetes bacterium]|nr:chemotaxis protein CheW [Armatimonadota bacterium]